MQGEGNSYLIFIRQGECGSLKKYVNRYVLLLCFFFFFSYIFWWRYATLLTFIFFHTIHYRTWLDHITQYMMRLRLADVYEWNRWIFLGSHHTSNCDEAEADVLAWNRWSLRLQSVAEFFDLPPQLGLEPATHTSEALAERYLNGCQRILGN